MKVAILIGFNYYSTIKNHPPSEDLNSLTTESIVSDRSSIISDKTKFLDSSLSGVNLSVFSKKIFKNNSSTTQSKTSADMFYQLGLDQHNLFLPGIIVDLYQAYQFARKMNPDKILVLTDIKNDPSTIVVKKAIVDEIVDGNILNFITDLKDRGEYYHYSSLDNLIDKIKNICSSSTNLFTYYTGHSKNGYFILPDDVLSANRFRKIILTSVKPNGNITLFLDCCNGNRFGLPFKLNYSKSSNVAKYSYISSDRSFFTTQRVICISSTGETESSGTTILGSIFTKAIFRLLKNRIRSINHLISEINRECQASFMQTSTIYTSHPDLYYLGTWLFGEDEKQVVIDSIKNILVITKSSEEVK